MSALSLCLWLALPALYHDVSVFVGPAGGAGNVEVLDEGGLRPAERPPALQGIRLLPVDFVGRVTLTELLPDEPRLRGDVPLAARILLPHGQGALYRYARSAPVGTAYGFFVVDRTGRARGLWELTGSGPLAEEDPLLACVALSVDGTGLLAATTFDAGGDLFELDLARASAELRTGALPPRHFHAGGLALLADFGLGLASEGPVRFPRTPGVGAATVDFDCGALGPGWVGPEVVKNADDDCAAFASGRSRDEAFVFTCRATGPARQVSRRSGRLVLPGSLPDDPAGPRLALSSDASHVAWCSEEGGTRECWLRALDAPQSAGDVLVSGDDTFDDTLDETGVIAFFSADAFLVLAGEAEGSGPGGEPRIGEAELFRVDARGADAPLVTNLSRTGVVPGPPFDYGHLCSSDGVRLVPGGGVLLRAPGAGDWLVHVSLSGGSAPQPLLDHVAAIEFAEATTDHLLIAVRRDLTGRPRDLLRLPLQPQGQSSLLALPDGSEFGRQSTRRSAGVLGAVLASEGLEWLGRVPPGQQEELFSASPKRFGPTLAVTESGAVAFTLVAPAGVRFVCWPSSGPAVPVRADAPSGFVLPGT